VEHAYSSHQTPAGPWRTAAIVAAGVAAVELFVLIVVAVIFGAKLVTDGAEKGISPTQATKPAASTESVTTDTPQAGDGQKGKTATELPRNRTSVVVLNGNGVSGAAAVTADRVRGFHYVIAATGNAPRSDFERSFVMYRPGYKDEGLRLAHDLHLRRALPLDGLTLRDLQGAHLALIIGG
jgi:LytR cell envelope-related transcriptional attenuator